MFAANRDLQSKLAGAAQPAATPAWPDLRERVGELEAQVQALRTAPPAYPDLRNRVQELETAFVAAKSAATATPAYPDLRERTAALEQQLAAAKATPSVSPDYPDLRPKVAELEQQLAATKAASAAPAFPDLRPRVSELELQLAAVQEAATKLSTGSLSANEAGALKTELADAKERLATALRGYSLIEKERDDLAAKASGAVAATAADKDALAAKLTEAETRATAAAAEAARLGESLAALQRSTGDTNRQLASTRALLEAQQGSNTVLAQENLRLKSAMARAAAALPAVSSLRTHTVAAGDSLSKISQLYYGTPGRWSEVYEANRDVIGTRGELRVGSELRIP
ncbi:MAG: LysM peptidoglycan-binding domain-containing protein [Opitutales bacterium]